MSNTVRKDIGGTTFEAAFTSPLNEHVIETASGATVKTGFVAVHKKDEEGFLLIDRLTGQVAPLEAYGENGAPPAWAEVQDGMVLSVALLTERALWYTNRIGAVFANSPDLMSPDLMAYEDLSWVISSVVDDDVSDVIDADLEGHRMQVLGNLLGITEDEDGFATVAGAQMEVEIAYDTLRTSAEVEAFDKAQKEGFEAATATGTKG